MPGNTAEILALAGLLDDDRPRPMQAWLEDRLATLAPGIAGCARSWFTALRDGTARTAPRDPSTARLYLYRAHPALQQWSGRYEHLREVTAADVTAALAPHRGHERRQLLIALRSLMQHCKKHGLIFADPAAGLPPPAQPETIILPLPPERIAAAVEAASTPAARLALALAAVHALGPAAIRHLALADIDISGRRLTAAGTDRPLDDLTRDLALQWLAYRRERWPQTSSPYLIINNHTAMTTRPVTPQWLGIPFIGTGATLGRLCTDRQLHEALTAGPDPIRLAAMFGIGDETAIKYAAAARRLLASAAEEDPPG